MSEGGYRASQWRLLAHTDRGRLEIENRGEFDELAVQPWLHVEQLDSGSWWLRVGDARLVVTLAGEEQADVDVIRGYYSEERGATTKHAVPANSKKP